MVKEDLPVLIKYSKPQLQPQLAFVCTEAFVGGRSMEAHLERSFDSQSVKGPASNGSLVILLVGANQQQKLNCVYVSRKSMGARDGIVYPIHRQLRVWLSYSDSAWPVGRRSQSQLDHQPRHRAPTRC